MDYSPFQQQLDKDDYYLTPEGYRVFTAKYLLKRGYCCKNGCRHCPYKKSSILNNQSSIKKNKK